MNTYIIRIPLCGRAPRMILELTVSADNETKALFSAADTMARLDVLGQAVVNDVTCKLAVAEPIAPSEE